MSTEIAPAVPPTATPTFFRRHRLKIVLVGFVAVLIGLGALWTLITLTFSYSDGDRVGYVQKFSHKGWVCRTWEGELAMTPCQAPRRRSSISPCATRRS
jgi:hypothetical protein